LRKRSGETRFEKSLHDELKKNGIWFIKLKPTITGFPDRMALMAPGRKVFVELKGLTGVVSPAQDKVHRQLRELGFHVLVIKKGEYTVSGAYDLILFALLKKS
jgi:G:T-mismatch repair DNA endonuclease (very short patch repair protein)